MLATKTCAKCGEVKALSEFYVDKSKSSGRASYCKNCVKCKVREWEKSNPEKKRAASRKYRQKFPVKIASARRVRYLRDPTSSCAKSVAWQKANPEKMKIIRAKRIRDLTASYLCACMRIKVGQAYPELLELKRSQLKITRELRKLNKEIQNGTE